MLSPVVEQLSGLGSPLLLKVIAHGEPEHANAAVQALHVELVGDKVDRVEFAVRRRGCLRGHPGLL